MILLVLGFGWEANKIWNDWKKRQLESEAKTKLQQEAAWIEAEKLAKAKVPGPADAPLVRAVGEEFQHDLRGGSKGPMLVMLPAGSFKMGSDSGYADEKNGPQVTIAKPFAMGKFEVTVKEYLACVAADKCKEPVWREKGNKYHYKTGSDNYYKQFGDALTGDNYPIGGVSWHDAKTYVAWLNESKTERAGHYSLPSEAQWEYAARAKSATKWSHGDDDAQLGDYAWYSANSGDKMHMVGTKVKNKFGLYDMHGNVWEWIDDCYHESYSGAPKDGSVWLKDCQKDSRRVLRGGGFISPVDLRSANRYHDAPAVRYYVVGLRVAWTPQ